MVKLDDNITDPQERLKLVNQALAEAPTTNGAFLEMLANYLIKGVDANDKKEKKEKKVLTDNRLATVHKRETSFEGLAAQLENGEDGIYNLMSNDKYIIFRHKVSITDKDLREIPELRQTKDAITTWENRLKTAKGKDRYIVGRTIKDLRQAQYVIKNNFRKPITPNKIVRSKPLENLDDDYAFDKSGYIIPYGASLCDPEICSIILCNYSKLKAEGYGRFENDLWYIMEDFDNVSNKALRSYPLYRRLVELKVDGLQNLEIQEILFKEFNVKHSIEYISSLWRNKIPGLIASCAEDELLDWHFLEKEKGKYKKCSRCGKIKLAHNKYFSKNKTSKDHFYSICKCCRNKKKEGK